MIRAATGVPWALVRSYLMVTGITAGEGLVAFLFPPYLDSLAYPIDLIGLLAAVGPLAALASRLPAGVLYRGTRARTLLTTALATSTVTTLLLARVDRPLAFALLRAIAGFSYGIASTTNMARFIDAIPPGANRASAMGLFSAAWALGFTFGNGLGGFVGEVAGYEVAFYCAAAAQGIGVLLAVSLPPLRAERKRAPSHASAPTSIWARLAVLGDPGMLTVSLAAFLIAFMQTISGVFSPLYGLSVGLALTEIAVIRVATSLLNVFGRSVGSPFIQRLGRERVQHIGLGMQGASLFAVAYCTGFWPLLAVLLFAALWRAVVLVANTIALTEDVDEERVPRGMATGLYNAATDLGQIVGPSLGGAVAAAFDLPTMFRVLPPLVFLLYLAAMLARAHLTARR